MVPYSTSIWYHIYRPYIESTIYIRYIWYPYTYGTIYIWYHIYAVYIIYGRYQTYVPYIWYHKCHHIYRGTIYIYIYRHPINIYGTIYIYIYMVWYKYIYIWYHIYGTIYTIYTYIDKPRGPYSLSARIEIREHLSPTSLYIYSVAIYILRTVSIALAYHIYCAI